jgi:predicted metal-dependent hydrolase
MQKTNRVYVLIPKDSNVKSTEVQMNIRKEIEKVFRKEANQHLPIRLSELAGKHNFNYNKVTIKNSKTRWGSCSGVNNINLNLHLMRLPDKLMDYVILHELAHTKIKNHQKEFWNLLDAVSGDAKGLDKELKKYHIYIY